jgi:hypothetical protein
MYICIYVKMTELKYNSEDYNARRDELREVYRELTDEFGAENTERLSDTDVSVEGMGNYGHKQEVMIWYDWTREGRGEGVNEGWMVKLQDGDETRKKIFNDDFESALEFFQKGVQRLRDGNSVYTI